MVTLCYDGSNSCWVWGSSDDSSTYTYSSELDIKNLDSSDAEDGCSFTALHAIIDGLMKPAKDGTTTYGIAKSSEVSEEV